MRMTPRVYAHSIALACCLLCPLDLEAADKNQRSRAEGLQLDPDLQRAIDQTALEYRNRYYQDDLLQGYVNELGQSLVPKEIPPGILFSFRVIDDPTPNAVALPDGRIFVHAGLLAFVDSEAQLATILGHEIAHVVEMHTVEAIRAARSLKRSVIAGLVGGLTGALAKSKEAGDLAAELALAVQSASFSRKQEDEADLAGARYAMGRGFDPRAAVGFFEKLTMRFGRQGRLSNVLFGTHSLNEDRARNIERLLAGELASEYNKLRSEGRLALTTGEFRFYASGMVRDTAIRLAELYDRYDLAKERLESIVDIRSRDPKTLWHLGRIYRLVARTDEDKQKALDLLQKAADADERALYPEIHRDLALLLATRTGNSTAASENLRKYVSAFVARHGRHPPDLAEIYDYLLMFGDGKWLAPEVPRQVVVEIPERSSVPGSGSGIATSPTAHTAPAALESGPGASPQVPASAGSAAPKPEVSGKPKPKRP